MTRGRRRPRFGALASVRPVPAVEGEGMMRKAALARKKRVKAEDRDELCANG